MVSRHIVAEQYLRPHDWGRDNDEGFEAPWNHLAAREQSIGA